MGHAGSAETGVCVSGFSSPPSFEIQDADIAATQPGGGPCQTALADIGLQPFAIMGLEQPVQMLARQTGRGGDPIERQRRIEMRLDIVHRRLDMLLRRQRHPTGPPARRHRPGFALWRRSGAISTIAYGLRPVNHAP